MLWETKREALARQAETYERALAIVREENSQLRRLLDAAHRRTDQLTTDLVKSLATSAAPAALPLTAPPPAVARRTSRDPIEGLGNAFDPVPYDHPLSSFTNERAASLMDAEDEETDGVPAAA